MQWISLWKCCASAVRNISAWDARSVRCLWSSLRVDIDGQNFKNAQFCYLLVLFCTVIRSCEWNGTRCFCLAVTLWQWQWIYHETTCSQDKGLPCSTVTGLTLTARKTFRNRYQDFSFSVLEKCSVIGHCIHVVQKLYCKLPSVINNNI